jgi:molecular chaperone HscB
VTCWACKSDVPPEAPSCPACGKLQPAAGGEDLFAALGLPRRFDLEPSELEARFRERSRRFHPDRFARADARERRIALDRSTRLNDAHRTLREPRRRAEYLLRLAGHDPLAEARTLHDPEFLEEQLEVREQLAIARAEGDAAAVAALGQGARERLAALEGELGPLFAAGAPHEELSRRLARARYYDSIIADAVPSPQRD